MRAVIGRNVLKGFVLIQSKKNRQKKVLKVDIRIQQNTFTI